MTRRTALLSFLATSLVVASSGVLAGCPATATTTAYTPITGILIRSSSLVAGYGCGTGPDQVFQYGAFLSYASSTDDGGTHGGAVYSGVFDCYSDGLFSNLPADEAGSLSFDVTIVAWNQASFPAALTCGPVEDEAGFMSCPGDTPGILAKNEGTPTWTTRCSATQQAGVSVIAVCAPLTPTGAGDAGPAEAGDDGMVAAAGQPVLVDTHGFVTADGGTYVCGTDFQTARATYASGSQSTSATCPAPLSISPTVAGAAYGITVELFEANVAVAQVACQATASATAPVTASCAPATGP